MRNSRATSLIIATVLVGSGVAVQAAELATLFTTPEERRLINSNRYKTDEARNVAPVQAEVEAPVQQLLREEVTREYLISGITVSPDGAHKVWINSALYEDGAELDDRSRIKVIVGDGVRVRITLPDGRHMYATSGEKLQVTYLATVRE